MTHTQKFWTRLLDEIAAKKYFILIVLNQCKRTRHPSSFAPHFSRIKCCHYSFLRTTDASLFSSPPPPGGGWRLARWPTFQHFVSTKSNISKEMLSLVTYYMSKPNKISSSNPNQVFWSFCAWTWPELRWTNSKYPWYGSFIHWSSEWVTEYEDIIESL